jgi:hypothetical protein
MLIWVRDEANCFCATGWTGQISLKMLGKFAFRRSVDVRTETLDRSKDGD